MLEMNMHSHRTNISLVQPLCFAVAIFVMDCQKLVVTIMFDTSVPPVMSRIARFIRNLRGSDDFVEAVRHLESCH